MVGGEDYKVITNKTRDSIFVSKDGLRKIRFDVKNTYEDKPHIHLEEFVDGKWRDAVKDRKADSRVEKIEPIHLTNAGVLGVARYKCFTS